MNILCSFLNKKYFKFHQIYLEFFVFIQRLNASKQMQKVSQKWNMVWILHCNWNNWNSLHILFHTKPKKSYFTRILLWNMTFLSPRNFNAFATAVNWNDLPSLLKKRIVFISKYQTSIIFNKSSKKLQYFNWIIIFIIFIQILCMFQRKLQKLINFN